MNQNVTDVIKLAKLNFFTLVFLAFTHCQSQTFFLNNHTLNPEHWDLLHSFSREKHVVESLQKKIDIHLTYLSPPLYSSLKQSWEGVYGENNPFTLPDQETVFLVSMFTPDTAYEALDAKDIWKISLQTKEKTSLTATKITPFLDKHIWSYFFPFINHWSKEYLVTFPSTPVDSFKSLSFHSLLVKTQVDW